MTNVIDCHVHSKISIDSDVPMKIHCQKAIEQGLKGVIFTDHWDFDPTDSGYNYYDYNAAKEQIDQVKETFPELKILHGVEITYQKKYQDKISSILETHEFDYVIGSVHIISLDEEKIVIDLPEMENTWLIHVLKRLIEQYYLTISDLITSKLFDTVGHLDMFKRYMPPEKLVEIKKSGKKSYLDCLKKLIDNDMTLEINTSAYRHGHSLTYPSINIIKDYYKMGGRKLVLASDAHQKEHLAYNFRKLILKLKTIGFDHAYFYEKRERHSYPL
ncbi:MAG: histidinol-phosphatase HisJ family protein [Asgard group archaeon]|nr:histidinol-phosphatase HisJ family protein [Asgard group archaeon]